MYRVVGGVRVRLGEGIVKLEVILVERREKSWVRY